MPENLELPRGCEYVEYPTWKKVFNLISGVPREFDIEDWRKKWSDRERWARNIGESILRQTIIGNLDEDEQWKAFLATTVEPSHLSTRVLLAKGLNSLSEQRLVLVTGNKVGSLKKWGNRFAFGERLRLTNCIDLQTGQRKLELNFVGIVLNTESPLAKPMKDGQQINIPGVVIGDLFDAVVTSQLRLEQAEQDGTLDKLMNQSEVDRALEWFLTGK